MRMWLQRQSSARSQTASAAPPRPVAGARGREVAAAPGAGRSFGESFIHPLVAYGQYLEELRTAKGEVATKLAEHKALKKAGTIQAPPP